MTQSTVTDDIVVQDRADWVAAAARSIRHDILRMARSRGRAPSVRASASPTCSRLDS
jgi:hypothetical protein